MNAKSIGESIANSIHLVGNTIIEAQRTRFELAREIASAIRLARLEAIRVALDLPTNDMKVIEIAEKLDR